jgi:F0F1-type ATP synthase beta subunit
LAQTPLESGKLELEDFESRSKKFDSFDSSFIQNLQKIRLHVSPLTVARIFTDIEGKLVDLKDTIASFKAILNGEGDNLP